MLEATTWASSSRWSCWRFFVLRDGAYGMAILEELQERTGREVAVASVYSALDGWLDMGTCGPPWVSHPPSGEDGPALLHPGGGRGPGTGPNPVPPGRPLGRCGVGPEGWA